jgi:hypothetical protein
MHIEISNTYSFLDAAEKPSSYVWLYLLQGQLHYLHYVFCFLTLFVSTDYDVHRKLSLTWVCFRSLVFITVWIHYKISFCLASFNNLYLPDGFFALADFICRTP